MCTDLAEWLDCLTANAEVPTVPGSIPASSDTVESEGQQMKHCGIKCAEKIFSHLWSYPNDAVDPLLSGPT
jgi:hypothetical protein